VHAAGIQGTTVQGTRYKGSMTNRGELRNARGWGYGLSCRFEGLMDMVSPAIRAPMSTKLFQPTPDFDRNALTSCHARLESHGLSLSLSHGRPEKVVAVPQTAYVWYDMARDTALVSNLDDLRIESLPRPAM